MIRQESYSSTDVRAGELGQILSKHFGIQAFRPGQLEAILATVQIKDSLVVLPTGAGKSLCFQLPPFTRQHAFTVVVSPLLSLAKDQVEKALDKDIDARVWNSGISEGQRCQIVSQATSLEPEMRLLYVTPEALRVPALRDALKEAYSLGTLLSFAVDEAHCVSEWGHDFRPAYLELSSLKEDFPLAPIACFTASCTARVQQSIQRDLQLKNAVLVKASFNRPNIQYSVRYKNLVGDGSDYAVLEDLVSFINEQAGQCGIIYARLRTSCDWICKQIECANDMDIAVYHAGKDIQQRNRVHADWSSGAVQVVVATVAFGMGIDRPDVRWVVHWNAPSSLEGLYQESGRAGRDMQASSSVVYASKADIEQVAKLERGHRTGSAQEVSNFFLTPGCRRKKLLAFFGEKRGPCAAGDELCDFCLEGPKCMTKKFQQPDRPQDPLPDETGAYKTTEDGAAGAGNSLRSANKRTCHWSMASAYGAACQPSSGLQTQHLVPSDQPEAQLPGLQAQHLVPSVRLEGQRSGMQTQIPSVQPGGQPSGSRGFEGYPSGHSSALAPLQTGGRGMHPQPTASLRRPLLKKRPPLGGPLYPEVASASSNARSAQSVSTGSAAAEGSEGAMSDVNDDESAKSGSEAEGDEEGVIKLVVPAKAVGSARANYWVPGLRRRKGFRPPTSDSADL